MKSMQWVEALPDERAGGCPKKGWHCGRAMMGTMIGPGSGGGDFVRIRGVLMGTMRQNNRRAQAMEQVLAIEQLCSDVWEKGESGARQTWLMRSVLRGSRGHGPVT